MKKRERRMTEHMAGPKVLLETDSKFEKTLTVVSTATDRVIGFLTLEEAEEAARWAAEVRRRS